MRVLVTPIAVIAAAFACSGGPTQPDPAPLGFGSVAELPDRREIDVGFAGPDGSVLSGTIEEPVSLVGGVPAKVIRPLKEEDKILVRRKTRGDIPDDFYGDA